MQINENWRLVSEELNVTLQKRKVYEKGKNQGEEYWTNVAYCHTPQDALKYLVKREVMGDGMEDLKTVCDKIDELYAVIDRLKIGKGDL